MKITKIPSNSPSMKAGVYFNYGTNPFSYSYNSKEKPDLKLYTYGKFVNFNNFKISEEGIGYYENYALPQKFRTLLAEYPFIKQLSSEHDVFVSANVSSAREPYTCSSGREAKVRLMCVDWKNAKILDKQMWCFDSERKYTDEELFYKALKGEGFHGREGYLYPLLGELKDDPTKKELKKIISKNKNRNNSMISNLQAIFFKEFPKFK